MLTLCTADRFCSTTSFGSSFFALRGDCPHGRPVGRRRPGARKRLKTDRDYAREARRPDKYTRQRRKAAQAAEASNSGGTGSSEVGRMRRSDAAGTPRPLTVYGGPREPAWPPPTPPEGRRSTGPGSALLHLHARPFLRPARPRRARTTWHLMETSARWRSLTWWLLMRKTYRLDSQILRSRRFPRPSHMTPSPPTRLRLQWQLLRLLAHRRPRRCLLWVYGSPAESTWHAQWSHQWSPRNQGSLRALLDVGFR